VHCSNDHETVLGIEDVAIVHSQGTVIGYRFDCPACATPNEVPAGPDTLAVLHAFGVKTVLPGAGAAPDPVSAHRVAVSLRVLLDDPEAAAALFERRELASRVEEQVEQSGSPSV
jgi:hypothetical protein